MPAEETEYSESSDEKFLDVTNEVAEEEADVKLFDIELPDSSHFQSAQWTDEYLDVLRGSHGSLYEGRLSNFRPCGRGRLWDSSREQYVEGVWDGDCLTQLHFAQFRISDRHYNRLNGLDALITSTKDNFVARIHIKTPLRINTAQLNFTRLREKVEGTITITQILDDDLKNKLCNCRQKFEATLRAREQSVTTDRTAQRDMFHAFLLLEELTKSFDYENENDNFLVLSKISNNDFFSRDFRKEATEAFLVEHNAFARNKSLPIMRLTQIEFSWKKIIRECVQDSLRNIKSTLFQSLPTRMFIHSGSVDINNFNNRKLFTCSVHDIQLFADLELTTQQYSKSGLAENLQNFVKKYVSQLWTLTIAKINNTILDDIIDKSIFTNSVFLQLYKTFLELLETLCKSESELNIMTIQNNCDLVLSAEEHQEEILLKKIQFLVNLMNHFKPGDVKKHKFDYKFYFFKINNQWYKKVFRNIISIFDNTLANISQEYVIWLYYIHHSFTYLSENSNNKNESFLFLNSLMDLFKTVIKKHELSLEKTRILATSVITFSTTVMPYFLEEESINAEDMSLLLKQAEYMKDFVTARDEITNIVDIYQVFWDERKHLFTELSNKYPNKVSSTKKLIKEFYSFVDNIFNLKIRNNVFLLFLRSFNEFIRLLHVTNFSWYVKYDNVISLKFVELVDETNKSYLVTNTISFVEEFKDLNIPRQYLLDVAIFFLECTQTFLSQNDWSISDKMQAASELLLLMGKSFINFKKLPNAVDFDKFFDVFTEPFHRVTTNSNNLHDFKRRLGSLENYYKYTIELNEMSATKALELCAKNISSNHSEINYSFTASILESCFNVYLDKFNKYVDEYILNSNFDIKKLANHVKLKTTTIDITKWDTEYKTTKLPKLLAGLSAVWSAQESRDIVFQNKVMKPHCIQILCVLRLLGVDQPQSGFDSHLAQVLTGQGKSLVLGLLAATLALTGNRVRIVCYNKYLADRDKNAFQPFYRAFNIQNDINYGTFEEMANEILNPQIKGKIYNLRTLVKELITGDLPRMFVKEEDKAVSKTVLLIDEVDVFFSPTFYGNTFNPCTNIGSEVIADLQKKIWISTSDSCDKANLKDIIQTYIDFVFPKSTDNKFVKIVQNSRDILNKYVDEMISDAVVVQKSSLGDSYFSKFKLRDDGFIITVDDSGAHRTDTFFGYNNIFMYFKLKGTDFDHKGFRNYGYLITHCGNVSYAMLPKDYRRILGVTGTLKQLSDVEMRAVRSYQISRGSDMPTFFGASRLTIDKFTVKATEAEWITAILDSIMRVVEEKRAVLVFFVDEYKIDAVRDAFTRHLSRYSVLTGNETNEEVAACVEEAGVARKVTVTTRHMGRGVDFKSNDSSVEAKGGVHVIQTFYSDDVKEETQIMGRTARKDNSGSYEAVLCREHLSSDGYEDCSCWELNTARAQRAEDKGKELAEKIEQSKHKHDATMEFLRSFYDFNPNNRFKYFQNYPFIDL